jgi:hypothetical protein
MLVAASRVAWLLRPLDGARVMSPLGVDDAERHTRLSLSRALRDARRVPVGAEPELVVHPACERDLLIAPDVRALLCRARA